MKVAIVEDDSAQRELIKEYLKYTELQENVVLSVDEYETGLTFLGNFRSNYDIILLDIEMPGINGIETAKTIRKADPSVIIIFITNLAQYAVDGYEVEALDFIVKPVNKNLFAIKMHRAVARSVRRNDGCIQIKNDGEIYSARIDSVYYVESEGHYSVYHTTEGVFREYATLKETESKIGKSYFTRCNRCYLVNLKYVDSVKKDFVIVGKDSLAISRNQKKEFLGKLSEYLGGGFND